MAGKTLLPLALLIWMSGCASPPPVERISVTRTLPPPVFGVTHAAATPTRTPHTATPAQLPIPRSELQQLADELFGARQMQAIEIPSLHVKGAVVPVGWKIDFDISYQSGTFEWDSPDAHVGWVINSALPDEAGNIILYGHNNLYEKIFQDLWQIQRGDAIILRTAENDWQYVVREVHLLPILGADESDIARYTKYIQPTATPRLTLISCYPPQNNTHRVVVIGAPVQRGQ